jgi:hypothetical protein
MDMNKIVIIGVEPPCPRCKLLGNIIGAEIKLKHQGSDPDLSKINNGLLD